MKLSTYLIPSLPLSNPKQIKNRGLVKKLRHKMDFMWGVWYTCTTGTFGSVATSWRKGQDMKTFDTDYTLLEDMYNDGYFPDFLVDKVKALVQDVIGFLETGERDLTKIQERFDAMTLAINDLEEEFEENGSEIETAARDSIGETVDHILKWFDIDIDVEDAIAEREW